MRRSFVLCVCAGVLCVVPEARAELQVGAAVRVITPDPLLPVSGGMGTPNPAREKRGDLTARAIVLRKGDVTVAVVALDVLGFPSVLGDRVRKQVGRIPAENILIGSTHTHSAPDCYAFPDGKGGHTGDLDVHGLRLRQGRRGGQRGDRPPPAGPDQDRHRRGQGEDRLQLLRPRPVRPADERDPGGRPARQDDRHARQLRDPSRSARQRASASSAPTWSARSASGSRSKPAAWPCS